MPNIIFGLILLSGIGFFVKNINKLRRNIKLGKSINIEEGSSKQRWANMARIALGQSKMVRRPISGLLHIIVYVGFIVINIEVLEIVIDGLFGTHRVFSSIGSLYGVLIGIFEVFALLVFVAVVVFWLRRNVLRIKRFMSSEMKGWPKLDGNLIL
ncbi:MAG: Fe-S oxidoreductase, partial [Bacteroidetes bacterium]|nr:Fe-S oxidoreductase [Bacteroidota bacterium]